MARSSAALRTISEQPEPQGADLDEVREFAQHLPERFLHCREMGHNWRPYSAGRWEDGGFERVIRCTRCKTKRFQGIDSRGLIVSSHYEHPEGYLSNGLGRIVGDGRGALRLESIKRIVSKAEEEA